MPRLPALSLTMLSTISVRATRWSSGNSIKCFSDLEKRKIGLQSLRESIDTTTSGGRLIFRLSVT